MAQEKIPSKYYTSLFLPLIVVILGAYYNGLVLFLNFIALVIFIDEFFLLSIAPNLFLGIAFFLALSTYRTSREELCKQSELYERRFYYGDLLIALISIVILFLADTLLILGSLSFFSLSGQVFVIAHLILATLFINISFIIFIYYCFHYYNINNERLKQSNLDEEQF